MIPSTQQQQHTWLSWAVLAGGGSGHKRCILSRADFGGVGTGAAADVQVVHRAVVGEVNGGASWNADVLHKTRLAALSVSLVCCAYVL